MPPALSASHDETADSAPAITLGEHRLGRFDRRMPIGPACWSFHDLFWVHEGSVRLDVGGVSGLVLSAPAGLLILPQTEFAGSAIGGFATASICHFSWPEAAPAFQGPGHRLVRPGEALHAQAMLRLSLDLVSGQSPADLARRQRLLRAIIDCFDGPALAASDAAAPRDAGLELAWRQALSALHKMRTLSDVAALMGVHESALRARHRRHYRTSAGSHLRELRLRRAEDLLATTRFPLGEIARTVGYGHAETFIAAFQRSRGCTPGEFRHRSNPFA
ncbi:MAG: helix-turn-helix transcriptional regulator [Devosia sp.]